MTKKMFFVFFLLISVVVFAGCNVKKQNNLGINKDRINFTGAGQNRGQGMFSSSTWQNLGEKGSIENLKVGEKITVMGIVNQDGSINANRIMIGEMPRFERPSTTPEQIRERQRVDIPDKNTGERSQFNREGNMPNGERKGFGGGGMFIGQGEILKTDENSLILKTEKEGTKIIYFTLGTEIYIFSSSTQKDNINTNSVK